MVTGNKRKYLTAVIILFIVSNCLSALDFTMELFSFEKPVYSAKHGVAVNVYPDSTNKYFGINTIGAFDMKELYGDAGIRFEQKKFDFTTSGIYAPLFFDCFNLGTTYYYHFYNYSNRFYEHDFMPGIYFKWHKTDFFSVTWCSYFLGKYSVIPSVRQAKPVLPTNTLGFYLGFLWNFDFCKLHFDLKTFDYFDYPIFFSPFVEIGAEKEIWGPLSACFNMKSEWIDVFTIAANPTTFTFEVYVKVVF